jgi:hypothetical protein
MLQRVVISLIHTLSVSRSRSDGVWLETVTQVTHHASNTYTQYLCLECVAMRANDTLGVQKAVRCTDEHD